MIAEGFGDAGDVAFMREDAKADENGHDEQRSAKDGINCADDFADGKDCDGKVEDKDEDSPDEVGVADIKQSDGQLVHQSGRYQHERCAHTYHQDERHHTHHQSARASQLIAYYLGQAHTASPDAYHAGHIVVHCAAEDAAKHYPEERSRSVEHTHHGAEDGTCASDVEELHCIDLPRRHRDVVGSILLRVARRFAIRVNAEHFLYKCAVDKISEHQQSQRYTKCDHNRT